MLKKTIYISIEIKVREFISKLLFSYFAIQNGYRVYLGSREKIIHLVYTNYRTVEFTRIILLILLTL